MDGNLQLQNKSIQPILNGINCKADIWFNRSLLATITGAFIRGLFDITSILQKDGINILAIYILLPPHLGIPYEQKLIVFSPSEFAQLNNQKPRLWWPNGYGKRLRRSLFSVA